MRLVLDQDLPVTKFGTLQAAVCLAPSVTVSAKTGWPGVILQLGETRSLICNFYLSVAAGTIGEADLSPPPPPPLHTVASCWDVGQPTTLLTFNLCLFELVRSRARVMNAWYMKVVSQTHWKLYLHCRRDTNTYQFSFSWQFPLVYIHATGSRAIWINRQVSILTNGKTARQADHEANTDIETVITFQTEISFKTYALPHKIWDKIP